MGSRSILLETLVKNRLTSVKSVANHCLRSKTFESTGQRGLSQTGDNCSRKATCVSVPSVPTWVRHFDPTKSD